MKDKISKLINVYKKDGFKVFIKKCINYIRANYLDKISLGVRLHKKKYERMVDDILSSNYDRVIIWRSNFGYNVTLFQRPQHITNNVAKMGSLVFYEVTKMTDNVKTIKKLKDNIYLVNFNNAYFKKILENKLAKIDKPKYLQIYSTEWKLKVEDLKYYEDLGFKIIYEYIDELSSDISGTSSLPYNITSKYNYVMEHKDIYVVVTASLLEKDVIEKRGKDNLIFSSNGVDYDFFQDFFDNVRIDDKFQEILNKGMPIICYYGALASWFDYELIKKVDKLNKYSIVLFGVKYDNSFDEKLGKVNNTYFLGAKDYKELKYYANKCDILTIPFLVNDVTKATSPLKIFEYMALGKPIVITDLYECRKYKSVMVGKTHEEYIKLLDKALKMRNDKEYIKLLKKEAKENDWYHKAKAIIDFIKKDEK